MDHPNFTIKKAEAVDAEAVWNIRYAPEVNAVSQSQEVTPLPDHIAWFTRKYIDNLNNYCFVLCHEEKIMGYCRYDKGEKGYVISIALRSECQGKGLGSYFLTNTLALLPKGAVVLATIHKDNVGSQRLFEKNGFNETLQDETWVYLQHVHTE